MKHLNVQSTQRQQFIDITGDVAAAVRGWNTSAALVYVPHTTAGVVINEHADPDVVRDVLSALDRMVPEDGYRHAEGNSPAHVKSILVGSSQVVPLSGGRLALGTWQGVFFAEFDGPRRRRVSVVPLGSEDESA